MKHTKIENVQFRVGKWLPSDQRILEIWLKELVDEVNHNVKPLHPVIEADNPDIGLMCVMPVGMAEVSSCEITVQEC